MSGRFAIIPVWALDDTRMTAAALRVLLEFGRHTDKDGWCHPCADTIADHVGVGRSAIANQVRLLKEWGYLVRGPQIAPGRGFWWRVVFDADSLPVSPEMTGVVSPEMTSRQGAVSSLEVTPGVTSGSDTEGTPHLTPQLLTTFARSSLPLLPAPTSRNGNGSHPYWHENPGTLERLRVFAPPELIDGNFAAWCDQITAGTGVYWDHQMREYLAWLESKPKSRRHKNLRRGFTAWLKEAIRRDNRRRTIAQGRR